MFYCILSCRLSVNTMVGNLTTQGRGFAQISAAAMDGDFTQFITVEATGEIVENSDQPGVQPARQHSEEHGEGGG